MRRFIKVTAFVVAGMVVLGFSFAAMASTGIKWTSFFGSSIHNAATRPDAGHVVAKVGSQQVTVSDVLASLALLQSSAIRQSTDTGTVTRAQAYQVAVRQAAIRDEAQRRGIVVSLAEGQAIAKQQHELLLQQPSAVRSEFLEAITAQGLTEDQYWNDYGPKGYAANLVQVKLRQQVMQSVSGDMQTKQKAWTDFETALSQNASVTAVDPSWTH